MNANRFEWQTTNLIQGLRMWKLSCNIASHNCDINFWTTTRVFINQKQLHLNQPHKLEGVGGLLIARAFNAEQKILIQFRNLSLPALKTRVFYKIRLFETRKNF